LVTVIVMVPAGSSVGVVGRRYMSPSFTLMVATGADVAVLTVATGADVAVTVGLGARREGAAPAFLTDPAVRLPINPPSMNTTANAMSLLIGDSFRGSGGQ
jgi:hypothetical protein